MRNAGLLVSLATCFADLVVHAEVEDGVHHAGHGCARTERTDTSSGFSGSLEGFAGNLFKLIEVKQDLILNIRIDGSCRPRNNGCRPRW